LTVSEIAVVKAEIDRKEKKKKKKKPHFPIMTGNLNTWLNTGLMPTKCGEMNSCSIHIQSGVKIREGETNSPNLL